MKMFIFTIFFSLLSLAQVPTLTSPVMDEAKVLNNSRDLESQIREVYDNGVGPQINILTIESLNGQSIEEYAHKVFTTWKLGDAKRDDGILLLISIKDRKSRIEVGQGLEGALTDLQSKRILDSLKPDFRAGNFSNGIQFGLTQIISVVSKKDAVQQPALSKKEKIEDFLGTGLLSLILGAAFLFLLKILSSSVAEHREINQNLIAERNNFFKQNESAKSQILELEKNQGKPFSEIKKDLKNLIDKKSEDLLVLQNKNKVLKDKFLKCDKTKLENKKAELKKIQSNISEMEDSISHYSHILKGGG